MSPEEIRLFFTNFPLVCVFQHNANSIAIFRHNIYVHQYNFLPFCRSLCVSLTVSHISLNQSAASITLYKPRNSFSHFILATILEKCLTKTFESTTTFIKATQIKRDESDCQSLTKVLYYQTTPLNLILQLQNAENNSCKLQYYSFSLTNVHDILLCDCALYFLNCSFFSF